MVVIVSNLGKPFEYIITPNRRLASFLSKRCVNSLPVDEFYVGKILAWQDFLRDLWERFRPEIQEVKPCWLMSSWQSHYCWQKVIESQTDDTLHLAKQATGLLQQWHYDADSLQGLKPDTDLFLTWRSDYLEMLNNHHAIDEMQLASIVKNKSYLKNILLHGFDSFTPEQNDFFDALKQQGCVIEIESVSNRATTIQRSSYKNIKQEVTQIALEIKDYLNENANPELPIGVVVPQLSEHWRLIHNIFTDVFSPYHHVPVESVSALPFNISAGQPLHDVNVIQSAWILLDLLTDQPSIHTWIQLCRTPFIHGGITQMTSRAQFEEKLRKPQSLHLDWNWVMNRKDNPFQLKPGLNRAPLSEKPSVWHSWILNYLQAWGWPGERNLTSDEYQAVMHFYRLLNELPNLDAVISNVSVKTMVSQLKTQALSRMFQPESEDKPIQILGMLEAAGQKFSQLWITGLSFDVWPQRPNPNPFIPTFVQVAENMPHANAQREYEYAQTMLDRLLTASDVVHLSYSKYELNGDSIRLPSPLIQDYPERTVKEVANDLSLINHLAKTKHIQIMPETKGLPLGDHAIKGGSGIFKAQAACPFQAYAKYRLNATAPELPVLGISALAKGNVIHEALETLWDFFGSQDVLSNYDTDQLTVLVEQHCESALKSKGLSIQQQRLEMRRSVPLIVSWLLLEKSRSQFKIHALEKSVQAVVNRIPLNLRQDRIDELPDGSFLLIDYKTGKVNPKQWLGLRPDEPQLPLYASLMETPLRGIAFGVLRCNQVELISLNSENCDWQKQMDEWRESIENLATEFANGRADLDPKYGNQTCQQCDLSLLCRVGEYERT